MCGASSSPAAPGANRLRCVHSRGVRCGVQILQYTLVGTSEVLASIGQIEFFYDQVRHPLAPAPHLKHTTLTLTRARIVYPKAILFVFGPRL